MQGPRGTPTCRVDRLTIPARQCPSCKDDFADKIATSPIVGFRGWKVTEAVKLVKLTPFSKPRRQIVGVELNAAGHAGAWNGREKVQAHCSQHSAPQLNCGCGLYIYKQPDFMDYGGNMGEVQGAVVAWGHMIEHKEGFRAEWAQPIFIFEPKDVRSRQLPFSKRVAELLQLPLVPFDKDRIAFIAQEYGDMMP